MRRPPKPPSARTLLQPRDPVIELLVALVVSVVLLASAISLLGLIATR